MLISWGTKNVVIVLNEQIKVLIADAFMVVDEGKCISFEMVFYPLFDF